MNPAAIQAMVLMAPHGNRNPTSGKTRGTTKVRCKEGRSYCRLIFSPVETSMDVTVFIRS